MAPRMRTPDGEWTVEVLRTRGGECFRIRRPVRPGQISRTGWGPIGKLRFTVDEVQQVLGDAFADLEDAPETRKTAPPRPVGQGWGGCAEACLRS